MVSQSFSMNLILYINNICTANIDACLSPAFIKLFPLTSEEGEETTYSFEKKFKRSREHSSIANQEGINNNHYFFFYNFLVNSCIINLDSRTNFFLAFENLMDALTLFLSIRFPSPAALTSLFRPSFSVKPRIADPLCERKSALESRLLYYVHDENTKIDF